MMKIHKSGTDAGELRRRAEQMAQWLIVHPVQGEVDAQKLLHELQVYHVELEMQNAELRQARTETEAALRQANLLNEGLGKRLQDSAPARRPAQSPGRAKVNAEMRISLNVITAVSRQIRRAGVNVKQAALLDQMDLASKRLAGIITTAAVPSRPAAPRARKSK